MLGANGLNDLIPLIRNEFRDLYASKSALAAVTAKDGTGVYVKRFGSETQEGPYPAIASGVVQVGQIVQLLNADSLPVVGWPIETSQRSNYMTLVGSDPDVGETTSHTNYESLLEVDGLDIPGAAFFWVTFVVEVVQVGTVSTPKQVLLQANGTTTLTSVSFAHSSGTALGSSWVFVGPYTGDEFTTQARNIGSVLGSGTVNAAVEDVTKVTLYGRTNDTSDENDILRVGHLKVFA